MLAKLVSIACLMFTCLASPDTAPGPGSIRVLYAGNPGSDREREYVEFLRGTFGRVDTVDYRTFREEMAEGHDVVIFDWTSVQLRDSSGRALDLVATKGEMNHPRPVPRLSERFSRPTILIGGPGQAVVGSLSLKIDDGCQCLHDHAHGMKADHPIFRGPFPVDLQLEEVATPLEYKETADGKPVGPTIQAWRVQTPRFFDADPGLVSRGDHFEEAPDAEAISSGVNSKNPEMVALGRQGNYFLWGFASPPSEMTPEARRCFLNVVCYIRQFDGQKPIVHKDGGGIIVRKSLRRLAEHAPIVLDPDGLRRSSPSYAGYDPKAYDWHRRVELQGLRRSFPAEVNDRAATDPKAYLDWFEANDRWIVPGAFDEEYGLRAAAIDEDLKALAMANRDVKTLDACVAMLARGEGSDRAVRILRRYTGLDLADAAAWKSWLDAHRDRLAFTEVGGFRFVVADSADAARVEGLGQVPLAPPGPPKKLFEPVKFSGSVEPARAFVGGLVTVTFRVEIAPGWHVAAKAGTPGSETPLFLRLALPAGLESEGEWTLPEPTFDAAGHGRYEGTIELRHKVRITSAAVVGKARITPSAYHQACDPSSCRPPKLKSVDIPFEVAAP